MTDQTIPADKVRPILDEWERIKEYADWVDMDILVQDVRDLLPPPTLADMTPEERSACRWMQCDYGEPGIRQSSGVIGYFDSWEEQAVILTATCGIVWRDYANVTPRPDLPRLEWPGDQKPAPAPSLPGGWRLADHPDYGRVIVTATTPDADGHVGFVAPATGSIGNDWHACDPAELTFLDQEDADVVD